MTDPCRDWRGALGAAALGGLDPAEEIGLRAHLDGCQDCSNELRELEAVARALDAAPMSSVVAAPAEPSSALGEKVLDRLASERGAVRSRRTHRALVGAGAGSALVAAAIAAVLLLTGGGGLSGTHVFMPGVGTERAASATATLHGESAGTVVDVKVAGLHAGDYYWLWVTGDNGHRVSAGTFQGSSGQREFRLMAAVPLSEARRIWVTDASNDVVLDARLPVSS